jgi:polyisoprenoid-binding protein YceI
VLLESLRRELAFIPRQLPDYREGAVHLMPPIRTVVGSQLLDGETLDWRSDVARIEASSVTTGDDRRDADLRSDHFLDVATFPSITFASTGVERVAKDQYRLDGELTIRDVTRSISLELLGSDGVADRGGGLRRGFTASGRIDRTDWGLTWNVALETGGWLVSEEIQIQLDIATYGPMA